MLLEIILLILTFFLTLVYLIGRFNERYWKKRGVAFIKTNKVTGLFWDFLAEDKAFFELFHEVYKKYPDEPAVAFGSLFTPAIYVKDPVNVNHIMHPDFQSFNNRGMAFSEKDILSNNVLLLYGPKWKIMRQAMSPLFTSSRLKNMYYIIDRSAQDFIEYLKNNPEKLKGNAFDILNTFSSAAFAASVFGLSSKSTFDSPFIPFVRESLEATPWNNVKLAFSNFFPSLFRALGMTPFPNKHQDWFIDAIKKVIRNRELENVTKHDFADLCVSLQKKDVLRDADTGYELKPTDEILAAQAFFFFLAGLEPCAAAMFGTLLELGKHPDILKKLHEAIDETFERCDGKLGYDDIMEMEYLDKVLNESLRMYPPIGFLTRECMKDTMLPVGNIKIDKGTKVFTPIYEYHHEPKFFDDPEKFNPERFAKGNKISDMEFMPFGKGNRVCLGMRFAKIQIKAGIVQVLRHFSVNSIEQKNGIKFRKEQVQVRLENVDFEFIPRNNEIRSS